MDFACLSGRFTDFNKCTTLGIIDNGGGCVPRCRGSYMKILILPSILLTLKFFCKKVFFLK